MQGTVSLRRLLSAAAAMAFVACGGAPTTPGPAGTGAVPVVLSTDLAVGANRFVFSLVDGSTGRAVGGPDLQVNLAFFDLGRSPSVPVFERSSSFVWTTPGSQGEYVARTRFSAAGPWVAEARVAGTSGLLPRVRFDVAERSASPAVGDPAPRSETRTIYDVHGDLSRISTDPKPMVRFYRTSIAGALALGVPFVVVFGSPGHCVSEVCQGMLDVAKAAARTTSALTFIHVEFFRDLTSDDPSVLDPAVGEWDLSSEPWLFAVRGDGTIQAKYEDVITADELQKEIHRLYR